MVEKYLQLPGGVTVTIKPQQTTTAAKSTYSLPNIHGDTLATTDGTGANTSTGNGPASTFTYDPFGNILTGSTLPTTNTSTGASFGYVGQHEKITEANYTLTPIQMGARLYIPALGRFTSVDPIQGGTDNNYVYPTDPVNDFDLDGNITISSAMSWVGKHSDSIGIGLSLAGAGACIIATAGVCTGVLVATAVAGGAVTTAGARKDGNSWRVAATKGAISTAIDVSGVGKVKAVRWFGNGRNYKSAVTAITKQAGKARAKAIVKDSTKSYIRAKIIDRGWKKWRR